MDVIINSLSPNDTIDIVRELKVQGLVQGIDFDFAYHRMKSDYITGHIESPEHTKFTFHDDKWATYFSLKYGHKIR